MPDFLRSPLGHTLGIDLNSLSKFSARSTQFSEGIGLLSNVRPFWDDTNSIYLHLFDHKIFLSGCLLCFQKCDMYTYYQTFNGVNNMHGVD